MENIMKSCLSLAAVMLALTTNALAEPDSEGPLASAVAFVEAFNTGDREAMAAVTVEDPRIIESIPPFLWTGDGALDRWLDDLADSRERGDLTDASLQLRQVHLERVSGLAGYVSAAGIFRFTRNGTAMAQHGSITFALTREQADWQIIGWSWSGKDSRPVAVDQGFVDDPDQRYH